MEIREKLDPPIPADIIHRLPFMNAKTASKLIDSGINKIDEIEDPAALGKSTRRHSDAHAREGNASASRSSLFHEKGCIFRWIKIYVKALDHR